MKRYFLIIVNIVGVYIFANAQTHTNCTIDSIEFSKFDDFLNSRDYQKLSLELLYYNTLDSKKQRDCFCDLIIYARVFDFILQSGLDLNYSIVQNPPIMNSSNLPADNEYVKQMARDNLKFKLYSDFLTFKESYEKYILPQYQNNKNKSLEQDVANIIRYGLYTHPTILQDILLSKYEHLTREKMEQELREHRAKRGSN